MWGKEVTRKQKLGEIMAIVRCLTNLLSSLSLFIEGAYKKFGEEILVL